MSAVKLLLCDVCRSGENSFSKRRYLAFFNGILLSAVCKIKSQIRFSTLFLAPIEEIIPHNDEMLHISTEKLMLLHFSFFFAMSKSHPDDADADSAVVCCRDISSIICVSRFRRLPPAPVRFFFRTSRAEHFAMTRVEAREMKLKLSKIVITNFLPKRPRRKCYSSCVKIASSSADTISGKLKFDNLHFCVVVIYLIIIFSHSMSRFS